MSSRVGAILFIWVGSSTAQATVYLDVAFSAAEGFVAGPLNGQNGWIGDAGSGNDTRVTPGGGSGSRAAVMTADGGFNGFFHLGAASPTFGPAAGTPVRVRQDIIIDEAGEADFLVQSVDGGGSQSLVAVQFSFLGNVIVNGVDSGADWAAGAPMRLIIDHRLDDGKAAVRINGLLVLNGIDLDGAAGVGSVEYGTDDSLGVLAASMTLDNVRVSTIPEPASLILIGAGAVAFRRRNRRRPANS